MFAIPSRILRFQLRTAMVLGLMALALSPLAARSGGSPSTDSARDNAAQANAAQTSPTPASATDVGQASDGAELPGLMNMAPEKLSPRLLEIRERIEWEQTKLAELSEAYLAATNGDEALRIQRKIHELKAGTELAILEIQLRQARLESKVETVQRLEAALEKVRNPEAQMHQANPAGRRAGGR